jgi:Putative prokaryotic signal transducing protein
MGDTALVAVRTFSDRVEADLAASALKAAGIRAMVTADDAGGTQPGLWEARGVAVFVRPEDEEAAREILETAAHPAADSD